MNPLSPGMTLSLEELAGGSEILSVLDCAKPPMCFAKMDSITTKSPHTYLPNFEVYIFIVL